MSSKAGVGREVRETCFLNRFRGGDRMVISGDSDIRSVVRSVVPSIVREPFLSNRPDLLVDLTTKFLELSPPEPPNSTPSTSSSSPSVSCQLSM